MKKLLICLIISTLSCSIGFSQINPDSLIERHIRPSDTDPSIWLWNADSNYVYINHTATTLNKLFVFLPGSYGVPEADKAINQKAANMGYHSIGLRYPNSWSMLGQCGSSTDTNCYYNLRMEVFYGVDAYTGISVDTINCIKNRLIKLLIYLDANYPAENWGQYLDINYEPVWNKIAMGGHSQGGGYGSLVALNDQLFRILNFASNDYSSYYNKPADWYYFPKVTTSDKYYGMVHIHDGPNEYLEMMNALGIDTTLTVNVDTSLIPYNNAHILFTDEMPASGTGWIDYHNSMAVDNSIPIDTAGNYLFEAVWQYMLCVDSLSTGINYFQSDKENGMAVQVYPNPSDGKFTIEMEKKENEVIEVYNVLGKVVFRSEIINQEYKINLNVPCGLYFYQVKNQQQLIGNGKLIIQ
ncbi:MAG: T9SS type A sorting domain-containing protein [Bacteroidota bacterium]